jgi:hypothetical protein
MPVMIVQRILLLVLLLVQRFVLLLNLDHVLVLVLLVLLPIQLV